MIDKLNITRVSTQFFLLFFLFLGACKEDLGNYDYTQLPDLNVDDIGLDAEIEKEYGSYIRLDPQITYGGEGELDYLWMLYSQPDPNAANPISGVPDTIARTRFLDVELLQPLGQYTLELRVIEENTGRIASKRFKLNITPPYAAGLLVAHERDGRFDIDFLRSPALNPLYSDTVISNIYTAANERRVLGAPVKMMQLNTGGFPARLAIMSTKEVSLVDAGTFVVLYDYQDLFAYDDIRPGQSDVAKGEGTASSLIIGNNVYFFSQLGMRLDNVIAAPDDKGLTISKVTSVGFIFDEKNYRFLRVPFFAGPYTAYQTNNPAARFHLHDIGPKELLFFKQGHNMGSGTVYYALFKDKVQSNLRQLYLISFSTSTTFNPDRGMVNVSAAVGLDDAVAYETITNAPIVYYATEATIHRISVSVDGSSFQSSLAGFTPPAGEVISTLKTYSNNLLLVATWNSGTQQASLYLLPIAFGGGLGEPLQRWTGFDGKITLIESKLR